MYLKLFLKINALSVEVKSKYHLTDLGKVETEMGKYSPKIRLPFIIFEQSPSWVAIPPLPETAKLQLARAFCKLLKKVRNYGLGMLTIVKGFSSIKRKAILKA